MTIPKLIVVLCVSCVIGLIAMYIATNKHMEKLPRAQREAMLVEGNRVVGLFIGGEISNYHKCKDIAEYLNEKSVMSYRCLYMYKNNPICESVE